MNLTLVRTAKRIDGIYGQLLSDKGFQIAVTLEHAYEHESGFLPKLPNGTYVCQRGQHRLHNMLMPFTTFEITGVTGHVNILFHWGNFNEDSDGCVLLGKNIARIAPNSTEQMITTSKNAFSAFMLVQQDVDQFLLTVKDA